MQTNIGTFFDVRADAAQYDDSFFVELVSRRRAGRAGRVAPISRGRAQALCSAGCVPDRLRSMGAGVRRERCRTGVLPPAGGRAGVARECAVCSPAHALRPKVVGRLARNALRRAGRWRASAIGMQRTHRCPEAAKSSPESALPALGTPDLCLRRGAFRFVRQPYP